MCRHTGAAWGHRGWTTKGSVFSRARLACRVRTGVGGPGLRLETFPQSLLASVCPLHGEATCSLSIPPGGCREPRLQAPPASKQRCSPCAACDPLSQPAGPQGAWRQVQEGPSPGSPHLPFSSPLALPPPPDLLPDGRECDRAAHELHGHPARLLAGGHPHSPAPEGHRPSLAQLLPLPDTLPAVPVPAVPGHPPSSVPW